MKSLDANNLFRIAGKFIIILLKFRLQKLWILKRINPEKLSG